MLLQLTKRFSLFLSLFMGSCAAEKPLWATMTKPDSVTCQAVPSVVASPFLFPLSPEEAQDRELATCTPKTVCKADLEGESDGPGLSQAFSPSDLDGRSPTLLCFSAGFFLGVAAHV